MRIFLDANALFSAAKSAGAIRHLLRRLLAADHVLCVDPYVVFEARRNLESKMQGHEHSLDEWLGQCEFAPYPSTTLAPQWATLLPEKDGPVLAAAIRMKCDALVTGDRTHFGALFGRVIEGVTIDSPRSIAERLSL